MPKLFAVLFLALVASASASKVIDIQGEGYLGKPDPANTVPIFVAIVNDNDFKIVSGTKEHKASVYLGFGAAGNIVSGLKKFDEWAAKAKEIKLESEKELLALSNMRFVFVSTAKGEESHLEMEMTDFDTEGRLVVWIEKAQLPKLIDLFEKVPTYFMEFREQQEKAKQLK